MIYYKMGNNQMKNQMIFYKIGHNQMKNQYKI